MTSTNELRPAHPRDLLPRNKNWAQRINEANPELFPALATSQHPHILWLGCSDSRVPETTLLDLPPGEIFVHRNIANLLPAGDLSSQCVLEYAVNVLQVKHIIVAGHYNCGGVNAALGNKSLGVLDMWLRNLRDVRAKHWEELKGLSEEERSKRLSELNVAEQVVGVRRNAGVQRAVEERGLEVHGWVVDVGTGLVKELECGEDGDIEAYKFI